MIGNNSTHGDISGEGRGHGKAYHTEREILGLMDGGADDQS
jgi:hypothetical protein